jgi:hypothetical protein
MKEMIAKTYGRLKTAVSRLGNKIFGSSTTKDIDFNKEYGVWYADVKNWPGPKGMLAMVAGADTWLDHLSKNTDHVRLRISVDSEPDEMSLLYAEDHPACDGAFYVTLLDDKPHTLWLCGVTEFVLGHMPKHIGIKVI